MSFFERRKGNVGYLYFTKGRHGQIYLGRKDAPDLEKIRECARYSFKREAEHLPTFLKLISYLPDNEKIQYMDSLINILGMKGEILQPRSWGGTPIQASEEEEMTLEKFVFEFLPKHLEDAEKVGKFLEKYEADAYAENESV